MQYLNALVARLFFFVLQLAAALGVLSTIAASQLEREASAATLRQVVTGRVCTPDGSPAVGAVVVTSAGGECVTGADGSFALTVELPLDAESLEVTAVADEVRGSGSLVASARIVPAAPSRPLSVGKLVLSESPACHTRWLPTFGARPGFEQPLLALAVYDDGGGPALHAGGSFRGAGGFPASGIARWDGTSWAPLGSGVDSSVLALAVHDDGGGPALYAGGDFTTAGGVAASGIAKWDGTSWSALGGGLSGALPRVLSLAVYDDGEGPALYAGGDFTSAGGVPANYVAKWDGVSWSALGSGMSGGTASGEVRALAVYDDGSGPALHAGGDFTSAGGVPANHIAKWDGTSWSALDGGSNGSVDALVVHDDGSGPALYAGGEFSSAGGTTVNRIARWNGSSWSALGSGMTNSVTSLAVYDDGTGPALYAGGRFSVAGGVSARRIARWNGTSWAALGTGLGGALGIPSSVLALAVYDDGGGPALQVGGEFSTAGGVTAIRLANWNGTSWSAGAPGRGINGSVLALTVYDDGGGPALHAGGDFTLVGGTPVNRIARWDGTSWSALGGGINGSVLALTAYDDGGGPALYAAGSFNAAGGMQANNIAKWNGTSWSALGSGTNDQVLALTVFDDGSGPALYAGGLFTSAGGVPASDVARWNGTSWSALGAGMSREGSIHGLYALTAFDDGSGPALYAGGLFSVAGGVPASNVAKWDGTSWSPLGSGLSGGAAFGVVRAQAVFDDGSGPALYAGGSFETSGSVAASGIARWNGTSWSPVGGGFAGAVFALAVHDDGQGPALFAGGEMGKRISKWNGSGWTTVARASGMVGIVRSLASLEDGDGLALHAGGEFPASSAGDSYLAKWGCRRKVMKGRF